MDKSFLSVAIILVNYNGYQDTAECIQSLSRIEYEEYEVIVVDNCSTDNSYENLQMLQDSEQFVLLKSDENRGFSAGNNIGIRYALEKHFDYILLLNNDTTVTPQFLIKLLGRSENDCAVVSGTILFYDSPDTVWYGGGSMGRYSGRVRHLYYRKSRRDLPKDRQEVSFISGCEMLIPAEAFNKTGFLDEDFFLYEEDADYCMRLRKAGYRLLYEPSSVIYHKVSASTSKINDMAFYYLTRNKRIMLYKNFRWYQIIPALVFTDIQSFYRILQGRMSVRCVLRGIKDYYAGLRGKTGDSE